MTPTMPGQLGVILIKLTTVHASICHIYAGARSSQRQSFVQSIVEAARLSLDPAPGLG